MSDEVEITDGDREAAAKDAEEWFPSDTSKRYLSFGVIASIRALDPAKIVGEG